MVKRELGITAQQKEANKLKAQCSFCRRRAYALATTGRVHENIVNPYQRWVLPYLPQMQCEDEKVPHIMSIVGDIIVSFVGRDAQQPLRLCVRQGSRYVHARYPVVCQCKMKLQAPTCSLNVHQSSGILKDQPVRSLEMETCGRQLQLHEQCQSTGTVVIPWDWSRRYRGAGVEEATNARPKCFFCRTQASVYVPRSCQDIYTARCTLCRRYACALCCEWELHKPYCWWCAKLGPTDSIAAHRLVTRGRATTTRLKHWQETPDWMDIVDFASNVLALQKCTKPPTQTNPTNVAHDPKDTFMAMLLSFFRDSQQLDKLLVIKIGCRNGQAGRNYKLSCLMTNALRWRKGSWPLRRQIKPKAASPMTLE